MNARPTLLASEVNYEVGGGQGEGGQWWGVGGESGYFTISGRSRL